MQLRLLSAFVMVAAAPMLLVGQEQAAVEGQQVFETTCIMCHSLTPPMKMAPPMAMISKHYRDKFTSDTAGVAAIARWVLGPDSTRSALPAHAIERFGLMPKQPGVSAAQAQAVARYVWQLSDSTATHEQ